MITRAEDCILADEFHNRLSWYAVKVRISHETDNDADPFDQFSLRLIRAVTVEQAAEKAMRFARQNDLDMPLGDGATMRLRAQEIVEVLNLCTDKTPGDGDEIWWRSVDRDTWRSHLADADDAATEVWSE